MKASPGRLDSCAKMFIESMAQNLTLREGRRIGIMMR
jgi:hypothetical protein